MIKNKLIYFFLAGTFLTACSDNEAPAIDPKAYPLVIKAKVYNSYDTEQEGVTWTKPEDIIGVYVLKSGSSEVVVHTPTLVTALHRLRMTITSSLTK